LPAHILVFDTDQLGGVKPVKFELRSKWSLVFVVGVAQEKRPYWRG
jgi:hypothetical protein